MPRRAAEPVHVERMEPLTIVIRRAGLILDPEGKPLTPQPEQEIVQVITVFP